MNLNQEQLEAIEKYAGLLMNPSQIATICEIDLNMFCLEIKEESTPAYKAFHKGLYTSMAELRETILGQAKAGSSPAQTQALNMLNELMFEIKL
jgi:hypothetical protein